MNKVKVKYLKKGMVLNTGAEIISEPVAGLYTPKGKVEIGVRYPGGREKTQLWNKETEVGVKST